MYASRRLLCTQTDGDDAQKKTTTYKEQDPAKVTHYLTQLAEFSDYQRVYLDETGFDRYLFRPYARSLKGQIVKAQSKWKKIPTLISGVRTSRQPADCFDGLSKYDDRGLF